MSDELVTMREERLVQQMDQIQTELKEIAEEDVVRMPERVFVQVFLPMFAGDKDLVYPKQATLANWINVARNPFKSVHVVDQYNVILFTVPPVYERNAVNPLMINGPSLSHIVQTAEQYGAQSPIQGQNYLNENLTQRALIMKVPVNVLTHIEKWNEIFKRYGRPPIMDLEEKKEVSPANNPGDFDVEFVYDDD